MIMHYAVSGQFLSNKSTEFLQLLTEGTIASQKPDGKEIVASMQRAVVDQGGIVRWSEVCYCPTPLQHERATVYDHFFSELETREIDGYQEFTGQPFMQFLQEQPS
jgi:hypothetical protein